MSSFHIVVDISSNGFGHVAQLAPILNSLSSNYDLKFTIRTAVKYRLCKEFFDFDFSYQDPPPDPEIVMKGPLEVDSLSFFKEYMSLYNNWSDIVVGDSRTLKHLGANLVISNISPVSFSSSSVLGIPSIGICSLNWADIFLAYCSFDPLYKEILQLIRSAYSEASKIIKLEPHMPMEWLQNSISVGPVAQLGSDRRELLKQKFKFDKLVSVNLGGILPIDTDVSLPSIDSVTWIVPNSLAAKRSDIIPSSELKIPVIDILTTSDALLSKAGYGSVTECSVNSTRLMYTLRDDWGENIFLQSWMASHCTSLSMTRSLMREGLFIDPLMKLLDLPLTSPAKPTGIAESLQIIRRFIY